MSETIEIEVSWYDERRFVSIMCDDAPSLLCKFDGGGWCLWRKNSNTNWWHVVDGNSITPSIAGSPAVNTYNILLDRAYEELITSRAIEEVILNDI
jgi:hypothetical protein